MSSNTTTGNRVKKILATYKYLRARDIKFHCSNKLHYGRAIVTQSFPDLWQMGMMQKMHKLRTKNDEYNRAFSIERSRASRTLIRAVSVKNGLLRSANYRSIDNIGTRRALRIWRGAERHYLTMPHQFKQSEIY